VNSKPNFMESPHKFEAGLQNYAGAIGLRAAVEYIDSIGLKNIERHEIALNKIITEGLKKIRNVEIIGGTAEERGGITSFNIKGLASTEASLMFDAHNVMLRGGFHCCHNWFNSNKINGSIRASLYLYNNEKDAERFIDAAKKVASLV